MIRFEMGSRRNTKCYEISIGGDTFYISYTTIIACRTEEGQCRIENSWGLTTGRHMKDMNVYNWPIVPLEELHSRIKKSIMKTGLTMSLEPFKR